jgi:prepilin-type N-terminal cleavage/methylation domain-containing protein
MKNLIRKGFSMIELLFVMVILSSLAAIAIPSMSSGTESARMTSMSNDTRSIINIIISEYSKTGDYTKVISTPTATCESKMFEGSTCFKDTNNNGFANEKLLTGAEIPLSPDNEVVIEFRNCADEGAGLAGQGFLVSIANTKGGETISDSGQQMLKENGFEYNSCTDGKIRKTVLTRTLQ